MEDVELADHVGVAVLASVDVDSLLFQIWVELDYGLVIVDTVGVAGMEESNGLAFGKSIFQFLWHFLYGKLIPIILLIMIIHKIPKKFIPLINAPRNNQILAIYTLTMKCTTCGFSFWKFGYLYFICFQVNDTDSIGDKTETLLKVVIATKADYFFFIDYGRVRLTETFHPWDLRELFPAIFHYVVDYWWAFFSAAYEKYLLFYSNCQ